MRTGQASAVSLARLRGAGPARGIGALAGMLALLLQLGVPLAHDPAGLGPLAPLLGVAMCHVGAGGTAGSPRGDSTPSAPRNATLCPICLGLQATASFLAPPAAGFVAVASLPAPPPLSQPGIVQDLHAPGSPAQPRAPPVPA